jgi:hypothetical protein
MLQTIRPLILPVALMSVVVVASNIGVRHPLHVFGLQDHLTWGAVIYPVSFLITDLTNRRYGVDVARRLVAAGFVIAVALSIWLASPRIALASGAAFLAGQLLDVTVFNRLRRLAWWRAPLMASLVGSAIDTALFFSLAFAGDAQMSTLVPTLFGPAPLWVNLAIWDGVVKVVVALLALAPYGALLGVVRPLEQARAAG